MQLGTKSAIVFPIALLLLLAALTFWIDRAVQPQVPKLDGSSRHDPDYVMSNFETTQTDVNGLLRYKLAASEMKHFPDTDATNLIKPRFTQFAQDKPYTKLQGDTGNVSSDGEEVEVFGNVLVTREAFGGKGELTVETDYLKVLPNEDYATTDRPVVIRQAPGTVIYATGLIYEKQQQTVTLLHRVRAHYERPVTQTKKNVTSDTKRKQAAKPAKDAKPAASAQPDKPNNSARIRRRYE